MLRSASLPCVAFAFSLACLGQSVSPGSADVAPKINRFEGTDTTSRIRWVRLVLPGRPVAAGVVAAEPGPILIAQCTLQPAGQYGFEMLASFQAQDASVFYPPWTPAGPDDLFPPNTQKATMTMEFFGYTHVKPLKREWEIPIEAPEMYRYLPPGRGSHNLEEIAFDLRYLIALPTMRLSTGRQAAEFMTTPLLTAIRGEPICRAAHL